MKPICAITLCTAVAFASGCAMVQLEKRAPPKQSPGIEAEPTVDSREKVAAEREQTESIEIVKAIEYALSLETVVWENRDRIGSKEDVLRIFRRGFCRSKAQEITDYVWIEAIDRDGKKVQMLNPGEPVLAFPDSIEVTTSGEGEAEAILLFEENLEGPVVWSGHTIVATLKREDRSWKICETRLQE
jgi:hypothetical protein